MLEMRYAMNDLNVSNRDISNETEISIAAVSNIANHNQWPRKVPRGELQSKIRNLFTKKGASAATLAALFELTTDKNNEIITEDNFMLLERQPLMPQTRRHFSLFRDPFGELEDSNYVFETPDTKYVRSAMEQTLHGASFLAVIGQSGAGKSTLRQDLLSKIAHGHHKTHVIEPYVLGLEDNDKKGRTLKAGDIAAAVIRTLDPLCSIQSSSESRYKQMHDLLIESHNVGYRHTLIIEEAHALSVPTLKHLKRFYELTAGGFNKLLSIILIGQNELGIKLAENDPRVREVVQRIEKITLDPLDSYLESYVEHRLRVAGADINGIIAPGALDALREKLTVPSRRRGEAPVSLLYPMSVGNHLVAAMNLAVELGEQLVTPDVIKAV